ncbi:MAG: hypothetical protein HY703_14060 [Gemmatimonadetes bacterium]|nr:hypothetical protein [Gemmatimonadota bacterium]
MRAGRSFKTAGLVLIMAGALLALGAVVVRDQISRHRRNLFSAHPLRRLAALGYLAGREATVEAAQLLRDFVAWEPRPLLRRRAAQILERMEDNLQAGVKPPEEVAG